MSFCPGFVPDFAPGVFQFSFPGICPRRSQNVPKIVPEWVRGGLRDPPGAPSGTPETPKSAPKRSKTSTRAPQERPRGSKERPGTPQGRAKDVPDRPWEGPREGQEAAKSAFSAIFLRIVFFDRFLIDFGMVSGSFLGIRHGREKH